MGPDLRAEGPSVVIALEPGLKALVWTPFVATGVWYLLSLGRLWAMNGRLRLGPDVMAFGCGALILGLPLAALVTLFVAAPLYRVLDKTNRLGPLLAVGAGGVIGVVVSVTLGRITDDPTMLPAWQAAVIGCVSAGVWWRQRGLLSRADLG